MAYLILLAHKLYSELCANKKATADRSIRNCFQFWVCNLVYNLVLSHQESERFIISRVRY
jgi:hypothetical protein